MKQNDPLPCPVCKENGAVTVTIIASAYAFVRCFECEIEGPVGAEIEDAIEVWNEMVSTTKVDDLAQFSFDFFGVYEDESSVDRQMGVIEATLTGASRGESECSIEEET